MEIFRWTLLKVWVIATAFDLVTLVLSRAASMWPLILVPGVTSRKTSTINTHESFLSKTKREKKIYQNMPP